MVASQRRTNYELFRIRASTSQAHAKNRLSSFKNFLGLGFTSKTACFPFSCCSSGGTNRSTPFLSRESRAAIVVSESVASYELMMRGGWMMMLIRSLWSMMHPPHNSDRGELAWLERKQAVQLMEPRPIPLFFAVFLLKTADFPLL